MVSPVFQARFHGWCDECGTEIEPGEEVTYDLDDELVHDECLDRYEVDDPDPFGSSW